MVWGWMIGVLNFRAATVSLNELYLDPENPRLTVWPIGARPKTELTDSRLQQRLLKQIVGPKDAEIQDLLTSFRSVGFLLVNQIQVVKVREHVYKVLEGNRRVAALKRMLEMHRDGEGEEGELSSELFEEVPVVIYEDAQESQLQVVRGLQHIGGAKDWPAINQALHIREMVRRSGDQRSVANMMGISIVRLRRALRTLSLIDGFLESDYSARFDGSMYSLFEELIRNVQIRSWIEWDESTMEPRNLVNTERLFSWVGVSSERDTLSDDDNTDLDLDPGQRPRDRDTPIIATVNEARRLPRILYDKDLISVMESTGSLKSAEDKMGRVSRWSRENQTSSPTPQVRELLRPHAGGRFGSIQVDNYRALSGIRLDDLRRVNLLAGINNAGKTSMLEAIYLLTQGNDVSGLYDVYRRRGKFRDEAKARWLDGQLPDIIRVSGSYGVEPLTLRVSRTHESDSTLDKNAYLSTISLRYEIGSEVLESRSRLYDGRQSETFFESVRHLCNSALGSPFLAQEHKEIRYFHQQTVAEKKLDRIVEFLRSEVDAGIQSIQLVDADFPQFMVDHQDFSQSVDLTQFGEGVQRIFHLCLMFAAAANGVLFIDELENAIHHSLLGKFTALVEELATAFDVQVFMTSHSRECIESFIYHCQDIGEISAYRLQREGETVKALHAAGHDLKRLIETLDVDLRGGV